MISNDTDFTPSRTRLALRSRVQIPDFLQVDAAERLRDCLVKEVPWTLAERGETGGVTLDAESYAALSPEQRQARLAAAHERARHGFQFAYDNYMMVQAAAQGRDPRLMLHAILEFLNSAEFLGFARWLTGDEAINSANAQATRYRAGHFLTRHEDQSDREGRAFAYVINLTRHWQADWGGQLQFQDGAGQVIETFLPRWNALSLFRVPQPHSVTLVAPWAGEDRLAITGWLLHREHA